MYASIFLDKTQCNDARFLMAQSSSNVLIRSTVLIPITAPDINIKESAIILSFLLIGNSASVRNLPEFIDRNQQESKASHLHVAQSSSNVLIRSTVLIPITAPDINIKESAIILSFLLIGNSASVRNLPEFIDRNQQESKASHLHVAQSSFI